MANSSQQMVLFLDVNVMMELFFSRVNSNKISAEILTLDNTLFATSILAVSTFFYYVEKHKYDKSAAHDFLANYRILSTDETDYIWAKENDQGDFEDALQVACALRHGCTDFMTLDVNLAKNHQKHIAMKLVR